MASVFETLNGLNVNGHTEKKLTDGGKTALTYLSWPWAWAEVKKRYPDAHYTITKDEAGLPYFSDPRTGIMVYTTVTIDGVTHEMWLPVMDGQNRAMRFEPYTVTTKYGKEIQVNAATMFDVNKTIMRCLTKNLAMFGLGLYIYAGEDLPEDEQSTETPQKPALKPAPVPQVCDDRSLTVDCPASDVQKETLRRMVNLEQLDRCNKRYGEGWATMTATEADALIAKLQRAAKTA